MSEEWGKLVALAREHELNPGEMFCITSEDALGILWAHDRFVQLSNAVPDIYKATLEATE